MQATRFYGTGPSCESVRCPSNTMAMDQLGLRSEVAVVSLVEVSDIGRPVGDFTLTLKRDVPEVGRQGHALTGRRVQRYVNKRWMCSFSMCSKVWPGGRSDRSAVQSFGVCKGFRTASCVALGSHAGRSGKKDQRSEGEEESRLQKYCYQQS
jgi:hypothetical protein